MNTGTIIKFSAATLGTWITSILGGWDMAIQLLVAAIVLDYITGILVAIKNKKVSSQIGRNGIIKKAGYIIAVIFAVMLDKILNLPQPIVRTAIIYICFSNEGISILENLGNMGVWLPKWLKTILIQIREQMSSDEYVGGITDKKEGGQDA